MAAEPLAVARTYQPAMAKRQGGIPQFLDKLYHMVEDPNTDLIKWSDTGDSFVVTDQERFSKEILGRWFKHQNFGSFVRQLNLYGFRKVPHLQQGALHSDTSQEPLCFENSNFQRGQPDLLHLISRKKQAAPGKEEGNEKPPSTNNPTPRTLTSANGALDVSGVLSGIAAIKRHQAQISNELTELKHSNQALWQEAITSRERYQRQQDTIDRILKFLAGVFGNAPGASAQSKDAPTQSTPSSALRTLHPQRLMIKGKASDTSNSRFVDHSDGLSNHGDDAEHDAYTTPPPDSRQFATISSITSPSAATPFSTDSRTGADTQTQPPFTLEDMMRTESMPVSDDRFNSNHVHTPPVSSALTSLVPANSSGQSEALFGNNLLTALLNDPANLQRVLSALNTISPVTTPTNGPLTRGSDLALVQNQPSLPSPPALSLDSPSYMNGWPAADTQPAATNNSHLDMLSSSAGGRHEQQLQKHADAADRLESHMNGMDSSLQNLLETFGLPQESLSSQSGTMAFDSAFSGIEPLNFDLLNNPVAATATDAFTVPTMAGDAVDMDWNTFMPRADADHDVPVEEDFNSFDSDGITASPASTAPALPAPELVEPKVPAKRKPEVVESDIDATKPKRNTRKKR